MRKWILCFGYLEVICSSFELDGSENLGDSKVRGVNVETDSDTGIEVNLSVPSSPENEETIMELDGTTGADNRV